MLNSLYLFETKYLIINNIFFDAYKLDPIYFFKLT